MACTLSRAPAIAPATVATVSVSPPNSIAATNTSSKRSLWRTAHTAWAKHVHTEPLEGSSALFGSHDTSSMSAKRSRSSGSTRANTSGNAAIGSSPNTARRMSAAPIAAPQPAAASKCVSAACARATVMSATSSAPLHANAIGVTRISAPLAALRLSATCPSCAAPGQSCRDNTRPVRIPQSFALRRQATNRAHTSSASNPPLARTDCASASAICVSSVNSPTRQLNVPPPHISPVPPRTGSGKRAR